MDSSGLRLLLSQVNCNDDLGLVEGRWDGSFRGGVSPTAWTGSADILHRWVSSNCSPVRYGQCWVYASVLCTGTVKACCSTVCLNEFYNCSGTYRVVEFLRGQKCGAPNATQMILYMKWVLCHDIFRMKPSIPLMHFVHNKRHFYFIHDLVSSEKMKAMD